MLATNIRYVPEGSIYTYIGIKDGQNLKELRLNKRARLREAPPKKIPKAFGHCPFSNCPPPPHSNGHSGALHFGKSAPNHPGKGLDPPK